MRKMYNYLKLIPIVLLGCSLGASAQITTFSYTGAVETYTVPVGVTYLDVTAEGATGGSNTANTSAGGPGGMVQARLTVTPGQLVYVSVGGTGIPGGLGGYNGGGFAGTNGGSGGGASDLRVGGLALTDRQIVAGGGGGAGNDCGILTNERGGGGGGLTGQTGFVGGGAGSATGGTQVSGSTLGTGGNTFAIDAGGGGGGYWGGLAGVAPGATCGGRSGGGGGSAYVSGLTSLVTHTPGGATGPAGKVTICSPGYGGTIILDSVCVGLNAQFRDTTGTIGGVWTSSNTNVATVDPVTGVVTGVAAGVDTITFTAITPCGTGVATAFVVVHALPSPITGVLSACQGFTSALSDADAGGVWSTSNTFTSINTSGVVTGLKAGASTISYSVFGCPTTAIFTVFAVPDTIRGPDNACVGYNSFYTDLTPGGAWASLLPTVGTIDAVTGAFAGVDPTTTGPVTIRYTQGGCYAEKIVLVNNPPGIITGTNSLCAGQSTTLTEFGFGGDWSTYNTTIATINSAGDFYAVAPGFDTAYYTIGGCPPEKFPVTINGVGVIQGISSICLGTAVTLTDTSVGGTWSSLDTNIAKISGTGILTQGDSADVGESTTIYYTSVNGCVASLNVMVNGNVAPITGPFSVCQGDSATLADATPGGTWTSTNLSIAQINAITGVATGISGGFVNISYTLASGCYAARAFSVSPPVTPLINLVRTPSSTRLCQFTPVTFETRTPINGGTAPSFTFTLFGAPVGPLPFSDSNQYTPKHGDVVVVTMITGTGICAAADTVRDSITYDIDSIKSPDISIVKGGSTSTELSYLGERMTFFSEIHYVGTAPLYQWYKNGAVISGATTDTYTEEMFTTVCDTIYCKVVSNYTCPAGGITDAFSNAIIICNNLYKLDTRAVANTGNNVTLFPNPTSGTLTLSGTVAAGNKEVSYEISDMLGRNVYSGTSAVSNGSLNEKIILSNVPDGSYMLRVNTQAGNQVFHFVLNK